MAIVYLTAATEPPRDEETTMDTTTITGYEAIEYARKHGLSLRKYADPTEGARDGLSIRDANDVAREDPSLIYVEILPGREP